MYYLSPGILLRKWYFVPAMSYKHDFFQFWSMRV
jgi:hypothetical protein